MKILTTLNTGVAFAALGLALISAPAMADQAAPAASAPAAKDDVIIVTGSMLGRSIKTPLPVTTITQGDLDKQGVATTQDSIQHLAISNGPALTNSFTANGAFAGGASGVSLRGLTTNSTAFQVKAYLTPWSKNEQWSMVTMSPNDLMGRGKAPACFRTFFMLPLMHELHVGSVGLCVGA